MTEINRVTCHVPVLHVSIYRADVLCGTECHAQGRIVIGRHPGADINLNCETISRSHAVLTILEDGFIVEDLGSRNGTFVNGRRVKRSFFGLLDEIALGTFKLKFRTLPRERSDGTWKESTTLITDPGEERTLEVTALPQLLANRAEEKKRTPIDPRSDTVAEDVDFSLSLQPDENALFPLADLLEPENEEEPLPVPPTLRRMGRPTRVTTAPFFRRKTSVVCTPEAG